MTIAELADKLIAECEMGYGHKVAKVYSVRDENYIPVTTIEHNEMDEVVYLKGDWIEYPEYEDGGW